MVKQNRHVAPTRPCGTGKTTEQLSVIILAASMGYRMKSFGSKSLIKTSDNITLLQHQIKVINSIFSNCEIIVVTGFESDKVAKNKPDKCRLVEDQNYVNSGEVGQLRLGLNNIYNNNSLIINGGLFFNRDTLDGITKNGSCVITTNNESFYDEVGITIVENKPTRFSYSIENKWSQICFLKNKDFKKIKKISYNRDNEKLYIFEALNTIIDNKHDINIFHTKDSDILRIDSAKDIETLKGRKCVY